MSRSRIVRNASRSVPAAVAAALVVGFVVAAPDAASRQSNAAGAPGNSASLRPEAGKRALTARDAIKPDYDSRSGGSAAAREATTRNAVQANARPATRALTASLGSQALVDIDGTTGTPRMVARLDGYLTGTSSSSATKVAMGYVRRHLAALGLRAADLTTFTLARNYLDISGTHHLSWTQSRGGVEVFGNGLQAAVTKKGRLLSLGGSPISGLGALASTARAAHTVGSRSAAIKAARRDLGEQVTVGSRDTAAEMLFVVGKTARLSWRVITMSAAHPATTVIDARSGTVLYRKSLSSDATSSTGTAYRYFPKHKPTGGRSYYVNYTQRGWLSPTATTLFGNNTHTYSDVNDNNAPSASEEVPPKSPHKWNYTLTPFHLTGNSFCDHPYPCSWDPNTPYSWTVNRKQNATQAFFFVNNWHDHLAKAPIGFTEGAGNFQVHNYTHNGVGGDPVDAETDDGANTDNGLPDGGHIDNANMDTPPDGQSPRMQLYLQHAPGASYPDGDPFAPTNVGDEADTVYHEYTHGLSNRLVIDATGNSTLGPIQAGAMGEAWSDWYAMDYLVEKNLQADVKNKVDVVLFQYDGAGVALDRTEPMDCKVGSHAAACNGGATGHLGGYTYADYGKVIGQPEVHSDGEIWAQTLWDLRDRLGSATTEALVTRAMELSPSDPSFLDERNAILIADTSLFGGRHHAAIWQVFAHRGMGYYAGSLTGSDSTPGADFHVPPTTVRTGYLQGRVTDADTHRPVAGAVVALAFEGGPGVVNPAATTDAEGRYRIGPVPVGTYPKLAVIVGGYDPINTTVTVTRSATTKNFSVRRDWAAIAGGATITSFNGPDFSPACGPTGAFDQSLATGWGSTTGDDNGDPTNQFVPKYVVTELPAAIDVGTFAVDPAATCGDGPSASTGQYRIETSPDGSTWTVAAQGTFTSADNGGLNPVTPAAGAAGVRFVRFTILSNQTPDFATSCPGGNFSGCSFTDLTEFEVYGQPQS